MSRWPSGRREALKKSRAALKDVDSKHFDGNYSFDVTNWLIPVDNFDWTPKLQEQLMDLAKDGYLSWVLVPPEGFRL